ncbi:hypothetical protein AB0K00_48515 [Dactylosporangium sp. NPDC049525]
MPRPVPGRIRPFTLQGSEELGRAVIQPIAALVSLRVVKSC